MNFLKYNMYKISCQIFVVSPQHDECYLHLKGCHCHHLMSNNSDGRGDPQENDDRLYRIFISELNCLECGRILLDDYFLGSLVSELEFL